MGENKHTPGPWELRTRGGLTIFAGVDQGDEPAEVIAVVSGPRPRGGIDDKEAERLANGRLMVAAPEILDALQFLADWRMRDGSPCFCPAGRHEDEPRGKMPAVHSTACITARAAIAKAEGR